MRRLPFIIFFLFSLASFGQNSNKAFGDGEYFRFRVHYGILTAGYAELNVNATELNGHSVYHIVGEGKTRGVSRVFFKVDDTYETYIDRKTDQPYRFIRDIYEGGYTKDIVMDFDHRNSTVLVNDRKHNTEEIYSIEKQTQDLLSSFYYARNQMDGQTLKEGDFMDINLFFDKENYAMRLKYLGKEVIRTPFGKVKTMIFRPYVQSGRVFKEKESLTVWISDDENKIPLLIKADLAVGSLKATLTEYKNLKTELKIE